MQLRELTTCTCRPQTKSYSIDDFRRSRAKNKKVPPCPVRAVRAVRAVALRLPAFDHSTSFDLSKSRLRDARVIKMGRIEAERRKSSCRPECSERNTAGGASRRADLSRVRGPPRRSIFINGTSSTGQRLMRATQRRVARINGLLRSDNATGLLRIIHPPGMRGSQVGIQVCQRSVTPVEMIRRAKSRQNYGTASLFRMQNETMSELNRLGGCTSIDIDVAYLHAAQSRLYNYATSPTYDGINRTQARPQTVVGTTIVTHETHNPRPTTSPFEVTTLQKRIFPVHGDNKRGVMVYQDTIIERTRFKSQNVEVIKDESRMSLAGGGYRLGTSQVSSRAWFHDHAALQIRSAALQKSRLSLGKQSGRWGSYLAMQPSQTTCCTLAARSMPISNTLSHAMLGPRSHISRAAALHRYVARPLSAAALERSFHAIEAQIPSASSDVLLSATESEIHLSEASGKTEMSYCCLIPGSDTYNKAQTKSVQGLRMESASASPISIPRSARQSTAVRARGGAMYHNMTSNGGDDTVNPHKSSAVGASRAAEDAPPLSLSDSELSYSSSGAAESATSPWKE